MRNLLEIVTNLLEHELVRDSLRAALILFVGLLVARMIGRRIRVEALRAQHRLLLRRVIQGVVYGITFAWALSELGLNLGVLLGAAGVLTIAVGFAAQASVSNLVSGVFLMVEQPFRVEHIIKVGDTTGEVIAIDLLSTKLRTFDNLYVRIPNETMLKAEVTNLTYFPIRRYDLQVGVAYKEDIGQVREVLFEVADKNPLCLEEPRPLLIFLGYGDSALEFQFSVWASREKWLDMRNSIAEEVKRAFDAHGIEIPFPHRSLYAGSATEPMPITIVSAPPRPDAAPEPPANPS